MRSYLRRIRLAWQASLGLVLLLPVSSAAVQQNGSITVTVLGADGAPASGVIVTLVGRQPGATTNNSGVAVIGNVPPGNQTLEAQRLGSCMTRRAVNVPSGGVVQATMVACADVVEAPNALASPLIGLLDLATNTSGRFECRNDLRLQGTGRLIIPGNAMLTDGSGASCDSAVLLLAPDHAPLYVKAQLPWTAGLGDVYSATMPVAKLRVPIRVFISDPALSAKKKSDLRTAIRTTHLAYAQLVLDDSYAGIELVNDEAAGGEPQIADAGSAHSLLARGCLAARSIRANPSIYSAGRINVYYVDTIRGDDGVASARAGYSCTASDAPEIILVRSQAHFPNTLLHELGHSLGLTRPDWGHSREYEGFYTNRDKQHLNVMAETDNLPGASRYFSVGQVAWMHLGSESWLNRASGAGGSTVRTRQAASGTPAIVTPCGCPETAATADCPALNNDISRTGTALGPAVRIKPCRVVPAASTVSLCANKPRKVDAKFLSAGGTAATQGSELWVSFDPSVATVASTKDLPSSSTTGTITGVSPGVVVVRAYVDGSFAAINVTVTPPC